VELQSLFDGAGNRRYEAEFPTGGTPTGHRYGFDSLRRLTHDGTTAITRVNPTTFEPASAPLTSSGMNGQQAIDAAIGTLATSPAAYTFRYDPAGNRLEERHPGSPPVTFTANALDQVATIDGTSLRHDLNGNLIDDGERLLSYNYRNQLTQVRRKSTGNELVRLAYDATGRLAALREGSNAVHLVNDGPHVIEEWTSSGVARQYVYGTGIDRRCQMAAAGEEWWYHGDMLGSTRWLSDSSGNVAAGAEFEYDLLGAPAAPVSHENPYLFAGRRYLRAAGLYDQRARQYSPRLGRFLQRDPRGHVDGPNLYLYAGNNPVTFTDPLGEQKATVGGEEPRPLAEEYMRGKYKPSVEEQAQLGGLIRAFVYLNPVWMGSPENIAKAEALIDRMLPFAYAPDEREKAKHLEVMWSTVFEEMLFLGLSVAAEEQLAAGLLRRSIREVAVAEKTTVIAARVEAATGRAAIPPPAPNIVPNANMPQFANGVVANGVTSPGVTLHNPGGLLGRLGLRRPAFNPTIEVAQNPVGSTVAQVTRHEGVHASDMLNLPEFAYMGTTSRVPGRGISAFIMETRGYFAEFGSKGLLPNNAWRSMTPLERAYFIGETAAVTGGAGYGGYRLLSDEPQK